MGESGRSWGGTARSNRGGWEIKVAPLWRLKKRWEAESKRRRTMREEGRRGRETSRNVGASVSRLYELDV